MSDQSHHEMVLETTDSAGAEEWYCPTCGRRMTITWEPWKKIVLEPGDIHAAHSGSKGILNIGRFQIQVGNSDRPPTTASAVEDPYLAPWVRWLEKMDWDDDWEANE